MEHKHAEVLRAIADGKEVEFKRVNDDEWCEAPSLRIVNPVSECHLEWRIKPKPKPPIVVEDFVQLEAIGAVVLGIGEANIRFTFDPDTKLPIKVELI